LWQPDRGQQKHTDESRKADSRNHKTTFHMSSLKTFFALSSRTIFLFAALSKSKLSMICRVFRQATAVLIFHRADSGTLRAEHAAIRTTVLKQHVIGAATERFRKKLRILIPFPFRGR